MNDELQARGDTKLARMEGKMDLVLVKLDDVLESGRATRANGWVIGFGLAGLIVAIVLLFPVIYDFGAKTRDVIRDEVKQQIETQKPPTAKP